MSEGAGSCRPSRPWTRWTHGFRGRTRRRATESLDKRLCGVWRVVRKHRNIIMRGFRIRTCSQGGWPPGRAPGQLRPRCRPLHQTARAHRPCRVHTHSTTGSRLNSLQWSLHILTPFTRRRPPLSQRWSGGCGLTPLAVPSGGPGFRVEPHGPISPWAAPALDAGREPRRRQFECAAAKSKAGVLWLVQAADRVKLPKLPTAALSPPSAPNRLHTS